MRFGLSGIGVAVAFVGAQVGAAQAQECLEIMEALRIPPVVADDPSQSVGAGPMGCSPAQLAFFEVNMIAVREAVGVTDPEQLYGTWLGDDVINYITGLTVPGQEVLRIGPGEEPGSIEVEQFWMKAVVPDQTMPVLWDEAGSYTGRVMSGSLHLDPGENTWRADPFSSRPIVFDGLSLEFERSYDLFVMNDLNHFDWEVGFRVLGDTLVLETAIMTQPLRDLVPDLVTYTRVADHAPEMALRLVLALEISQAVHFECLVHQISEGEGRFVDAMQPFDLAEIDAAVLDLFLANRQFMALLARARAAESVDDDIRDQIVGLADTRVTLLQSPVFLQLGQVLQGAERDGCLSLL